MPVLKVGQVPGKAASTIAAGIHELDAPVSKPVSDHSRDNSQAQVEEIDDTADIDPEYGTQVPGTNRYWTQSINGKPYAVRQSAGSGRECADKSSRNCH